MNNILDEIELRLRASSRIPITVKDMIFTWLGDKGYTGTLGQRLGEWGHDNNLGISRASLVATVPNPPTAVLAVKGDGLVTVSWSPSYEGGSELIGHYVTSEPGGKVTQQTNPDINSVVVTDLDNGTAYTFTVRARNNVGFSAYSSPSNATTPSGLPEAPIITAVTLAPSRASVTIEAPADDGGSPITAYVVTSDPSGLEGSGFSPVEVLGLTDGVEYTFTAVAVNSNGESEPSEASAPVVSSSLPGVPTAVVAVKGDQEVELTWTAPASGGSAITEYSVRTYPGAQFTLTSETNSLTFTGLTNGDTYQFEVAATNAVGTGAYSEPSNTAIPSGLPGTPVITGVVGGDEQVAISYTAAGTNGDTISSYTATSSPGGIEATGLDNPLIVTGLTNGTEYTFDLVATNSNGDGVASEVSDPVTPATVPDAPTIGVAVAGDASAEVAFTAPADDGGSAITLYTATASPGGATGTGTESPILVTGLANGVAHTFTVTATNAEGTSAASAASNSVSPTQSTTVPGAPTIGTATVVSATEVSVAFTAPANTGGSAITGYTVESTGGVYSNTGTSSPIVVGGMPAGHTVAFRVFATNGSGDGPYSAQSNTVTTSGAPGVPGTPTAVAGDTQVSLTFTAAADNGSPITQYTATSDPGGITATSASSPILVTGLSNGVEYDFTITATNANGTGSPSAASNAVTPAAAGTGPYDAYYDPTWTPVIGTDVLTTQAQSLPAVSTSIADEGYIDSRFGTRVYRVASTTSGDFASVSKLRHYYSRRAAHNCDGSMFYLLGGSRYYLFDGVTFDRVTGGKSDSSPSGAIGSNSLFPQGNNDIWWHATDPNILYFNPGGFRFYQYNVATQTVSLWRNFEGRLPSGMNEASGVVHVTTGAEGRPSDDGRYIVLMAWTTESSSTAANRGYFTVDLQNNTILGTMVSSIMSNNVTMSSLGNYAILARSDSSITFANAAASSTLRGVRAYSRDFSTFNQLHSTAGHSDPCIDMDGDECYVGAATENFNQLPWGTIFMRKCAGGLPVALYDKGENTSNQQHMSGCNSPGRPGWIIISTYHETLSTESGWGDNAVFAVKLSSPTEIRRIAHFRGNPLNNSYWDEPHATVSPDGLSVLFASRFRTSLGGALALTEQESFLVGLPSWFYGGSAPTGFTLLSNGGFDDSSVWTNTNATRWSIGSGVASCVVGDGLGAQLKQGYTFEVGATYRVTFDLTASAGAIGIRFLGGTSVISANETTSGAKTIDMVAVTGNDEFAIHANNTFVGSIDNVVMVKL